MQEHVRLRSRPPSGGCITLGTLILAAAAAVSVVSMSGCHASPPSSSGFVSSNTDKAREAQLQRRLPPMKPLQPFDEGFVVVDDADATP